MAGRASGIAMMSPPHAWKPTPRPDPAVQRGPRPMSCGRRDRLSTLPNGPDSNSKRNANDCRTTPREGLKQTPPRTPATGHGNAHVCVEPSKGSAISRTRGGEFPYRFERKKRQSFRRGHSANNLYEWESNESSCKLDPNGLEEKPNPIVKKQGESVDYVPGECTGT